MPIRHMPPSVFGPEPL